MKKLFIFLLAIIHLSASAGVGMHMHYCMNKAAGWGLISKESDTCNKCGMKKTAGKKNNCCKDEHKLVKNTADQKVAESVYQWTAAATTAAPFSYFDLLPIPFSIINEKNMSSHVPPLYSGPPVYIRNCDFRI